MKNEDSGASGRVSFVPTNHDKMCDVEVKKDEMNEDDDEDEEEDYNHHGEQRGGLSRSRRQTIEEKRASTYYVGKSRDTKFMNSRGSIVVRRMTQKVNTQQHHYADYDELEPRRESIFFVPEVSRKRAQKAEQCILQDDVNYYTKLPIRPGMDLLELLGPLPKKGRHFSRVRPGKREVEGLPIDRMDGKLYVRIPETMLYEGARQVLMRFSEKHGHVLQGKEDDHEDEKVFKRWKLKGEKLGYEDQPVIAVLKTPEWKRLEANKVQVISSPTLESWLERRPDQCILQNYVPCKGSKASIYRITWNRNKPAKAINIISNLTFAEATVEIRKRQAEELENVLRSVNAQLEEEHSSDGMEDGSINSFISAAESDATSHDGIDTIPSMSSSSSSSPFTDNNNGTFITESSQQHNSNSYKTVLANKRKQMRKEKEKEKLMQYFVDEKMISPWWCPSSDNGEDVASFQVASMAFGQVNEAVIRVVRHLENAVAAKYGLFKFAFEKLTADFIKNTNGEWVLLHVKGFELCEESYKEAEEFEQELSKKKDAQGDFYDSDEEKTLLEARKQELIRKKYNGRIIGKPLSYTVVKECKLCSRVYSDTDNSVSNRKDPFMEKMSNEPQQGNPKSTDLLDEHHHRVLDEMQQNQDQQQQAQEHQLVPHPYQGLDQPSSTELKKQALEEKAITSGTDVIFRAKKTRSRLPTKLTQTDFSDAKFFQRGSPKRNYEMTEMMAKSLRTQLALRGRHVVAFSNGILSHQRMPIDPAFDTNASSVGTTFQVCEQCFMIWEANERCLDVAKRFGKACLSTTKNAEINLPGAPGYGIRPGSSVAVVPSDPVSSFLQAAREQLVASTMKAADVAAMDIEHHHQKQPKKGRMQYRVMFFFQDLLDIDKNLLKTDDAAATKLQYQFQPFVAGKSCKSGSEYDWNDVPCDMSKAKTQPRSAKSDSEPAEKSSPQSRKKKLLHVRQARIHYIMAAKEALQNFFLRKRVLIRFRHGCSGYFSGMLYLTRFLTSFSNSSGYGSSQPQSMVNTTIDLISEEDPARTISIRLSCGIVQDAITPAQVDPELPFVQQDEVLFFPSNYFDLRPIPQPWLEGVIANQHAFEATLEKRAQEKQRRKLEKQQSVKSSSQHDQDLQEASRLVLARSESFRQHGNFLELLEGSQESHKQRIFEEVELLFDRMTAATGDTYVDRGALLSEVMRLAEEQMTEAPVDPLAQMKEIEWVAILTLLHDKPEELLAAPDVLKDGTHPPSTAEIANRPFIFNSKYAKARMSKYTKESLIRFLKERVQVLNKEHAKHVGSAKQSVLTLGAFSKKLRQEVTQRRMLRFKAYGEIWKAIDFDGNGCIDVAELRAYMRQRLVGDLEPPKEAYEKDFADWSLRDMHQHFCFWLGKSNRLRLKFDRYDKTGSGTIGWVEFTEMADQAFERFAHDEMSFAVSEALGNCPRHGKTPVFSIDLSCVICERGRFDPGHRQHDDAVFDDIDASLFHKVNNAAARMLRRLTTTIDGKERRIPVLAKQQKTRAKSFKQDVAISSEEEEEEEDEVASEYSSSSSSSSSSAASLVAEEEEQKTIVGDVLQEEEEEARKKKLAPKKKKTKKKKKRTKLGIRSLRMKKKVELEDDDVATSILDTKTTVNSNFLEADRLSFLGSFKQTIKEFYDEQQVQVEDERVEEQELLKDRKPKKKKKKMLPTKKTIIAKHAKQDKATQKRLASSKFKKTMAPKNAELKQMKKDLDALCQKKPKVEEDDEEDFIQAAEMETMFVYAKHGNLRLAKDLLRDSKLSINFLYRGMTALHVAAAHGQIDMIRFLLLKGANKSTKDLNGQTPLDLAQLHQQHYAANMLLNQQ